MLHKLHNVFVAMLRKSGMNKVTRMDTNHILREIGFKPDKMIDVEWTDLQVDYLLS